MRVDRQRDRWPRSAAGVPYPPAPWYLGGDFHLSAFRLPWPRLPDDFCGVVPTDHTVVRIGGRVTVGVAFVHYTDGGALAYEELLVALLVRKGARIRYSIPQIWVSSEESMHGGRELWGIPKQLGTFGRRPAGRSTRTTMTVDSEVVATLDASRSGPMLPGTRKLWLPTAQVLEGRRTVARNLVVGEVAMITAHWSFPGDGPLGYLAGHAPAFNAMIRNASVSFGMEAGNR